MTITARAAKMLWGRAAARCSMPDCKLTLVLDETEADDPALIGEMAHMVAESEDGPRGQSPLKTDERDHYSNLILLCRNHHREIDAQPDTWSVPRLREIKAHHETWVKASLPGYDPRKQKDDETFALYIDQWVARVHLSDWQTWIGWIFAHGQPTLNNEVLVDLEEVPGWTVTRVWPDRYPSIIASMQNFARVLRDFLNTFKEHATKPYDDADFVQTAKFYQIEDWDPPRYKRLAAQFEHHVDLVQDLALELTRAGNLACDEIRSQFLASFFVSEGRLSIMSGPHEDFTFRQRVVQYSLEERQTKPPYPGLDQYLIDRVDRDFHFGEGKSAP